MLEHSKLRTFGIPVIVLAFIVLYIGMVINTFGPTVETGILAITMPFVSIAGCMLVILGQGWLATRT
jgi:hypothetical protein